MPIATGNAPNVEDLFTTVVGHLTDNGWTQMGVIEGFTCLRAPGNLAGHEYFFWFRTYAEPTKNAYGFEMRAGTGYNAALPIAAQANISPLTFFNLWNVGAMGYWVYSNARRVVIIVKCSTTYVSMYAGALLPLALPTEIQKPFYIGGCYNQRAPYNVVNSACRFIADPGVNSAYALDPMTLAWFPVGNHASNINADVAPMQTGLKEGYVWPAATVTTDLSANSAEWSAIGLKSMRPTLDGAGMPIFPCHVLSKSRKRHMGVMDGVFALPGFGRVSEQIVTKGADDYRVFQNLSRVSERDYMAIKEA